MEISAGDKNVTYKSTDDDNNEIIVCTGEEIVISN